MTGLTRRGLNSCAMFDLHADDMIIISRDLRVHHHKQMMPHVFERTKGQAATMKQMVPKLQHVNSAYELLKTRLRAEQLNGPAVSEISSYTFITPH